MKIKTSEDGIELVREHGDKAISHESTVTYHLRRLLNERDGDIWVRCWPHKIGMTDCRQGVQQMSPSPTGKSNNTLYWHERYAIEAAHKAFNIKGRVFFSEV